MLPGPAPRLFAGLAVERDRHPVAFDIADRADRAVDEPGLPVVPAPGAAGELDPVIRGKGVGPSAVISMLVGAKSPLLLPHRPQAALNSLTSALV